jgi:hypothetical protein
MTLLGGQPRGLAPQPKLGRRRRAALTTSAAAPPWRPPPVPRLVPVVYRPVVCPMSQ